MTLFTTVAVATTVNVLNPVACVAILWCFFVTLARVAKFTTYLVVLAKQRKLCFVVIEFRFAPLPLFVAITAFLAEFSTMMIIVKMAIDAPAGSRAIFFLQLMTGGAVSPLVRAA